MRIEKRLENEAKLADEKILAEGDTLKQSLMQEFCIASEKSTSKQSVLRKKSMIVTICFVFVCLLTLGICLPILLTNEKPVLYLKENELSIETTLDTIYGVTGFKLDENNYTITIPTRVEDKISKDILYYAVKIESKQMFPYGSINFITNKNYELTDREFMESTIWNDSQVHFNILPKNLDVLPTMQIEGYFEYNKMRISFTYTDVDLGEQINPTDSLFII